MGLPMRYRILAETTFSYYKIFEFVNSCHFIGHQRCCDCAFCEALTGESFVCEGELVHFRDKGDSVRSGDFPDTLIGNFRLFAEELLDDGTDALGGSARGVKLVYVMDFFDVRSVAMVLEHLAGASDAGEECNHPDGVIGRPDERCAMLPEFFKHAFLDVVPACCADYNRLEIGCKCLVIGPERIGGCEVNADTF